MANRNVDPEHSSPAQALGQDTTDQKPKRAGGGAAGAPDSKRASACPVVGGGIDRVGALGVAYANRLSYAFDDPVTRELLAGMTSVAESAGAGLLLLPGSSDTEKRVSAITGAIVDGLLASSLADDDPVLQTAIARHLPLVVIGQPRPARLAGLALSIPWVGVEDRPAAAARPTALLCLSDRLAEGALKAAGSFGLRVPEDLSLIGFDDATYIASALDLTTVWQPHRRKGEHAAQMLLDLLNGSVTAFSPHPLPTALIIRGSTGPVPS